MRYPVTPAGIEPATFRFVAQHLNHCATAVPKRLTGSYMFIKDRKDRSTTNFCERIFINESDAATNLQTFHMQLLIFAHKLGDHRPKMTAFLCTC